MSASPAGSQIVPSLTAPPMTQLEATLTKSRSAQTSAIQQPYLSFRLSPTQLGMVPTDALIEVIALVDSQIVTIPEMPQHVMGVYNCRGEVIWLVNGETFFGLPLTTAIHNAILIRRDDRIIGFAVHQVEQMLWCNPADIEGPRQQGTEAIDRFSHWSRSNTQQVLLLDVETLFAKPQA